MTNIQDKIKDGGTISFKANNDGYLCANNINKVSLSIELNEQDNWKVEQVGACSFAFKSVHEKYLRANCNNSVDLSFDRREHEIWIVEQKGSSYFALKSCFGNFLRANDNGIVDLIHLCHNSELWLIEDISINSSHNDYYSFNSTHNEPYIPLYPREYLTPNYNNDYIQLQPAKPLSPLPQIQNQPKNEYQPKTQTSFELHPQVNPNIYLHNGRIVTLKSIHGTYLSGDKNMIVNLATFIGEWEKWKIETQNNDNETKIAFKSVHGTYLRAESSKKVMLSYVCGELERFSSEYKDGHFYFKSSHDTYLRAETNCNVTLGRHANHFEQWTIN